MTARSSGARKRTGPDLARVGGKYSDDWHRDHLTRSALGGAGLGDAGLSLAGADRARLRAHRAGSEGAGAARRALYAGDDRQRRGRRRERRPTTDSPDAADLAKRYPKAQARDFDGNPARITEADALIAYLQMLGTQVDFKLYDDKANIR